MPLFLSCYISEFSSNINNWKDTVITNNSSFTVTFKFNNTEEITLVPLVGQTTFKPAHYQHIEYYSPVEHVIFTYTAANEGSTGVFTNIPMEE